MAFAQLPKVAQRGARLVTVSTEQTGVLHTTHSLHYQITNMKPFLRAGKKITEVVVHEPQTKHAPLSVSLAKTRLLVRLMD